MSSTSLWPLRRFLVPICIFVALLLISTSFFLRKNFVLVHPREQHSSNAELRGFANAVSALRARSKAPVIVTAVNGAFCSYLKNLACSLIRAGGKELLNSLLIVPLDSDAAKCASEYGFIAASDDSAGVLRETSPSNAQRFGSEGFNILSKRKIRAVRHVMEMGVDVLFTDADIFWCRNALQDLREKMQGMYREYDIVTQTGWPRAVVNSGFYYVRSSNKTKELFEKFERMGEKVPENDQIVFNRILCEEPYGGAPLPILRGEKGNGEGKGMNGRPMRGCVSASGVRAGLIDPSHYPTGGEIIDGVKLFDRPREEIMRMCEEGEITVLHNNCVKEDKKVPRFLVKGLWYVKEDEHIEAHDGNYCTESPAPATKEAFRVCGSQNCGTLDVIANETSRRK